ncbi:NAD(P)-dependent dehydrogenase (short-subunit alcohol dehydrogenase family) [Nocardioides cavernae]|uniref:NAD(P)-dependent dehydrogenase (Short-subunit alcohol dehydrogenase family) n=1 Tax=Nocardioides cavernae TaxID=1921566 RepID=A0A7Y9H3V4_9ACTN|nr:SDR family oxidoreductase [Nocardioides cavernae]NYE36699.1 NAD(P)-dependent dehydrogenase (short-subunit alcohol dehydrogenase family) [Nocardioides cavernae]
MTTNTKERVALVTGGSAGLGRALCTELARQGWRVVTDGRSEEKFTEADLPDGVTALVGDLTDAEHRATLLAEVDGLGRLDLLVHNASTLGPLPMRPLAEVEVADLAHVWRTNVGGPLVLTAALLPRLRASDGVLLSISSDAAVQHYEGWGLYGASKAGLDHVTLTYAAETGVRAYAVDPGDMRTAMHQDASPGEDISDRPLPETVVPHLLALLDARPESGRYRAEDFR